MCKLPTCSCITIGQTTLGVNKVSYRLTSASLEHYRVPLTNPQRRDIIYAGGEFNEPNSQHGKQSNRARKKLGHSRRHPSTPSAIPAPHKKPLTISWISVQRLFVKATHLLRTKKITSPTTTTAPIIPKISGQLIDGFSSKLAVTE